MELTHLSDEEIQIAAETKKEPLHLNSCSYCSNKLTAYKKIFSEITEQKEPKLSNLFEMRIMNQVYKLDKSASWDFEQFFSITFAVTGTIAGLVYLLSTTIFTSVSQEIFTSVKEAAGIISPKSLLAISIAICVIMTLSFDSVLKKFISRTHFQK